MINFVLLTTTPAVLRTRLINQGILQNVAGVVPTYEGLEYVEVPNPIITSLGPPKVMDTRKVYLVKLVREALADEIAGKAQTDVDGKPLSLRVRTKLGAWIMNNSTAETITSADGRSWLSRKVGATFWLVANGGNEDAYGVWQ